MRANGMESSERTGLGYCGVKSLIDAETVSLGECAVVDGESFMQHAKEEKELSATRSDPAENGSSSNYSERTLGRHTHASHIVPTFEQLANLSSSPAPSFDFDLSSSQDFPPLVVPLSSAPVISIVPSPVISPVILDQTSREVSVENKQETGIEIDLFPSSQTDDLALYATQPLVDSMDDLDLARAPREAQE